MHAGAEAPAYIRPVTRGRVAGCCGAFLLCLFGLAADAAAQTVTDERVWFVLMLQERSDAPSPWRWSVETIFRSRDGVSALDVASLRPILNYNLTRHSTVGGGVAYVAYSPTSTDLRESRVFEHYVWTGAAAGGTLAVRARVEERFIEGNNRMAVRLRQVVRFSHAIKPGSPIAIVGYDEFFVHLNTTTLTRQGIDQNRAFAGISDTLNHWARFEVGYLNQFAPGHGVPDKMNHVVSGTLFFSF